MTEPSTSASAGEVADAVTAIPGVTGLYGGVFGEIATYLPGGRVSGVVLSDDSAHIHIVVDLGHDLRAVAAETREVTERLTGTPAVVTVEDISADGDLAAPLPADPVLTEPGTPENRG
ncbi:Asp23/Gls24 family envelope stress response protein [Gordonia insulae]|uniref:Asp23/Gls24 family envelope stress response protein n=1 Tax=Gordonia insulae TaxID=2420509 RepID=A0A3G8JV04_9ACTN|nr:hypothetical protein [Gordonia insulae]AZG48716.1 hypothetical protein D7316_05337 [Gordonia insulae]